MNKRDLQRLKAEPEKQPARERVLYELYRGEGSR